MALFSNNNTLPGSWFTPPAAPTVTTSSGGGGGGSDFGSAFASAFDLSAAEGTRQFDMNYQLQKASIDNQYKTAMMNARTQADVAKANARYQQQQYELAKETLSFEKEKFGLTFPESVRQFDATFGEGQRQFNATNALNQAQLGYNVLGQAAQLRGPENYFQAAEFARGASGNPNTSTFLSALQNNQRLAGFNQQGGLPAPETLGTLSAKLTGGGGGSDGNYLAQIGNIGAKGAHQLGNQALEQLTPTEQALFSSGLGELGYDVPTFLAQYGRSRIGQGLAGSAAA